MPSFADLYETANIRRQQFAQSSARAEAYTRSHDPADAPDPAGATRPKVGLNSTICTPVLASQ